MSESVISGSGVYTPPFSISNRELVESFNIYVRRFNEMNASAIAAGDVEALPESSAEFIEKASGITSRYVLDRDGILDPERMCPSLPRRKREEMSLQCEIGIVAARQALEQAGKRAEDVDGVLVACSSFERPYPAVGIEIQQALGITGYAFDMNVACSSATFGLQTAVDAIHRGSARAVLVVTPEICTGHLNFRDRDSHFIFGDVCTALLVERKESCRADYAFEVIDTRLKTSYSTNIYNGFGFLGRTHPDEPEERETLFTQEGRKVFKEVVPLAAEFIRHHLGDNNIESKTLKRAWLHQANLSMNQLIAKKLFGTDVDEETAPTILDTYGNTAAAGSIICFHKHHRDLRDGEVGILCSFGAGYSVGNAILRRMTPERRGE